MDVVFWGCRMSTYIPDSLTEGGAKALAAKVRSYWRERGHANVRLTVEPDPVVTSVFVVRSNLVGGKPPEVRST